MYSEVRSRRLVHDSHRYLHTVCVIFVFMWVEFMVSVLTVTSSNSLSCSFIFSVFSHLVSFLHRLVPF
jgi:uncharacterized MnhB-related membrane protein